MVLFYPAFGQTQSNPTIAIHTDEISYQDFNKVSRDSIIIELEKLHTVSWQVTIDNDLLYNNPDGNAVVRFYDLDIPDKFFEIGMGSPPDEKFWVAVQLPEEGYLVVNKKLERGWIPGANVILAYTDRAGLTVNNGERIVVSNLNIKPFTIASYSTHGMESSTDPPAVSSGSLTIEYISGNPAANRLSILPFVLAAGVAVIIGILILTKKRS